MDRFLKVTQLIKRRTVAKETAEEGVIKLNGRVAKASAEVKKGDTIEIDMWNSYKLVEVVEIPGSASIPKARIGEYIEVKEYRVK